MGPMELLSKLIDMVLRLTRLIRGFKRQEVPSSPIELLSKLSEKLERFTRLARRHKRCLAPSLLI